MNEVIGFALAWEECSYCGKRFSYNGLTMQGWEEAFKAKNRHESVCPKRFGFDSDMRKVGKQIKDKEYESLLDLVEYMHRKK